MSLAHQGTKQCQNFLRPSKEQGIPVGLRISDWDKHKKLTGTDQIFHFDLLSRGSSFVPSPAGLPLVQQSKGRFLAWQICSSSLGTCISGCREYFSQCQFGSGNLLRLPLHNLSVSLCSSEPVSLNWVKC